MFTCGNTSSNICGVYKCSANFLGDFITFLFALMYFVIYESNNTRIEDISK